jgi:hypothetical protein
VGDIRGLGLFAGIELVKDRKTKAPFDPSCNINSIIANRAFVNGENRFHGRKSSDSSKMNRWGEKLYFKKAAKEKKAVPGTDDKIP